MLNLKQIHQDKYLAFHINQTVSRKMMKKIYHRVLLKVLKKIAIMKKMINHQLKIIIEKSNQIIEICMHMDSSLVFQLLDTIYL